ncbi:hypothetical protein F5I97DRAFT_416182 [Phlebopus sp. FC_14]|nr:hypothetical protein F5I97DRAFT_416182 [Phlebopus sp. FC_14]
MRCSRCKGAIYCSNKCQTSDWPYHKRRCSKSIPIARPASEPPTAAAALTRPSYSVTGVTIACKADRARGARAFETKIIEPSHAIYYRGVICPLFQQVGFPLVLYRHLAIDPMAMLRDTGLDNQMAAHLMTHPETCMPDEGWKRAGCLGTVTVMRQDRRPLTFEAIETALMYVDHLLTVFHDGASPPGQLNPAGFQRFCQRYKDERIKDGFRNFNTMSIPL